MEVLLVQLNHFYHQQIAKVVECSDANLPRTIADIQVALRMCYDTLKVEQKFDNVSL